MQMNCNGYKPKEIIRTLREWTDLTQSDFAKSIQRSKKTIEGYEYGTRNVSLYTFLKICKTHNIEVIIRKNNNS